MNTKKKLNPKIKQLLDILNDQMIHDGVSLGQTLGVTRTAIWKFISQLEQYGLEIESVKGKGYRLLQPLVLLDSKKIKQKIADNYLKKNIKIEVFSEIDSTNDHAATILSTLSKKQENDFSMRYCCLAELQSQGRGRLGRQWFSPFGVNLYFSSICEFDKDIGELGGLSLIVGLQIIKTLEDIGIKEPIKIKWPNDIVVQDKKLAGILIEIIAETNGQAKAVVGIGINVNMMQKELNTITKPSTSLKLVSGNDFDRNLLCAALMTNLAQGLLEFTKNQTTDWMTQWLKYDYLAGKKILLTNHKQIIEGTACGINEKGFLLLKQDNNEIRAFSSGDTSVKNYE